MLRPDATASRRRRSGALRVEVSRGGGAVRAPRAEQHVEDVLGAADHVRAVVEERVRARRGRLRDAPGHGADVAAHARARRAVISDPDRSPPSTTTVSDASPAMIRLRTGKHHRRGANPGGSSDTTPPGLRQALVQPTLARGVRDVDPAPQHRDRRPARVERPLVHGGVDAERHPADDRHPSRPEPPPERPSHLAPVLRAPPGPDDRHRRPLPRPRVEPGEERLPSPPTRPADAPPPP